MNLTKVLSLGLLLVVASPGNAQIDYLETGASNRKVLAMGLYPPDMIMKHQQRLGITDGQRASITSAVKQFQSEVAELQWDMQNQQQLLLQSLSSNKVDQDLALDRAGRALEMESQFKLAHMKLLIAIKNELTDKQLEMIRQAIRQRRRESGSALEAQ